MNKKQLIVTWAVLFLVVSFTHTHVDRLENYLVRGVSAQEDELGDEGWLVKTRVDRVFYFTHGTAVWGHEFGFFKDANDCNSDTFWLTFSSSEEKVKDFIGKDVMILLDVDGKNFKITLPMLNVGTIGHTHIMMFTNWAPGEQLMNALMNGRYVEVQILEPKELKVLLDIKKDQFSLEEFAASREEAKSVCIGNVPH